MQELPMLKEISGHTIDSAIRLLDELKWSITVVETDGIWSVAAGHRLVLKTSSREAVQFRKYGEDATAWCLLNPESATCSAVENKPNG